MAINEMGFNQLSTVLADIVGQAKGTNEAAPIDTASFVSLAKTGLETGYDALGTAVSQVLSRTIFSSRPYNRRFQILEADALRYGNHVRKINYIDKPFEDDDRILLVDGESIDQQRVNKPKVLQTNFYGENVWQKSITIYRDQLDVAFSGADEFQRFVSGVLSNIQDQIEQAHENTARATLANLIGGYAASNATTPTPSVVHLITEYNDYTGESITAATAFTPEVFPDFARFVYGKIATLSKLMRERTTIFHLPFESGEIARHTPVADQRLVLMAGHMDQVAARVLSTTFNDEYLSMIPREDLMFWQSVTAPKTLNVNAGYTLPDGSTTSAAVNSDAVFGVLFDREAAGYTVVNEWSMPAPFNSRGGYQNTFYHFTDRYWNDFSENCFVLMLD